VDVELPSFKQMIGMRERRELTAVNRLGLMKLKTQLAIGLSLIATPILAAPTTPQTALSDAARYTVEVFRFSSVGLNADDGQSASGTGFLFDRKRGWILTNAHVSSRSPARLEVAFKDGEDIPAKRIFVDHYLDMAILQVDPEKLPSGVKEAQLDCDQFPAVGTSVAIFGNPSVFRFVASRGIVSGTSWLGQREHVQSDATINSGNSGGPLINLETGKVVGLASESYRDTNDEHSTSVALSEPMPPICKAINLLRSGKDANVRQLDAAISTRPRDERPIIAVVPLGQTDLRVGDVILKVDGGSIVRNPADLIHQLRGKDGVIDLSVKRGDQVVTLRVSAPILPLLLSAQAIALSGLVISEPWRLDSRFTDDKDRLVIDFILPETPAENIGVGASAVVMTVDGVSFGRLTDLHAYLVSKNGEGEVEFVVSESSDELIYHRRFTSFRLPVDNLKWINVSE